MAIHYFLEEGIPERLKEKREEDDVAWLPLFRSLLKGVDVTYSLPPPILTSAERDKSDIAEGEMSAKLIDRIILEVQSHSANVTFLTGDTLLHCAVKAGCSSLVNLLITFGAESNAVNGPGVTVLEAILSVSNENRMEEMLRSVFSGMASDCLMDTYLALLRYGTLSCGETFHWASYCFTDGVVCLVFSGAE
jgi:hypothetical protein